MHAYPAHNAGGIPDQPLDGIFLELWHGFVAAWTTLPLAFQAAGFEKLPDVLTLRDLQALCGAGCGGDVERAETMARALLRGLADQSGGVPRDAFLPGLGRCLRARRGFEDWANTMLLSYAPAELSNALAVLKDADQPTGARSPTGRRRPRQLLMPRRSFSGALDLAEVHPDDGEAWFAALREDPESPRGEVAVQDPGGVLHVGTLVRRILAHPWLSGLEELEAGGDGEEVLAEDIAIRLIHTWGDLTAAFGLRPPAERPRSSSASELPAFLNLRRSSSTGSLGTSPRGSRGRISTASGSRRFSVASASSQYPHPSMQRLCRGFQKAPIVEKTSGGIWPGAVSPPRAAGVPGSLSPDGLPSREQWVHALRGSMRSRLLHEGQARTQAALMLAKQASVLGGGERRGISALFPNLSQRLCIARSTCRKNELLVVRYSAAESGFYGKRIPLPRDQSDIGFPLQGDDSSGPCASASGQRPLLWGAQPFLAVVPFGTDVEALLGKEIGKPPTSAPLGRARAPGGFGTAALRAPLSIRSGGVDNLWALQLFASDDGQTALAPIGSQLPFRVLAELPRAPHAPELVSAANTREQGASLTLAWSPPEDDGGSTLCGHEVGVWDEAAGPAAEGEPLLSWRGRDVWPPYCVAGLQPDTRYVVRVRCESELGLSPWSRASLPFETPPPPPCDLGRPEVLNVLRTSATVRWSTSQLPVTRYEIVVHPQTGNDRWIVNVDPPPPDSSGEGPATSQTEATVEGLLADTAYTFSVRGINDSGSGPLSPLSDAVTTQPDVPSAPGAPRLLEATSDSLTLAWSPPAHDGGCPVVRYFVQGNPAHHEDDAKPGAVIERHTRDASTTLTVRRLCGNTRYVFRVYALNRSGLSPSSPPSEALITGPVPPGAPAHVIAAEVEGSTDVDLRWQPPASNGGSEVLEYLLDVRPKDHPEQRFTLTMLSPCARLTGLRGNSRYTVRIKAVNAAGACAVPAEVALRTGPVPPGPPGLPRLVGEVSAHSATLAWSAPVEDCGAAVLGYVVQHQFLGNSARLGRTCRFEGGDRLQATVDGLAPESSYRFRVRAWNSAGEGACSEWSAAVRTQVLPPPAPSTPAITAATMQSLTVGWAEVPADLCEAALEWEAMASCTEPEACPPHAQARGARATAPPLQIRGLMANVTYALRVRIRGLGGWSEWSAPTPPCTTSDQWSTEELIMALVSKFGSASNAFRSFEHRCDGFLQPEDFTRGLDAAGFKMIPEEQKLALFSELDSAQRGCITLREFSKCLARIGPLQPEPRRPSGVQRDRSLQAPTTAAHERSSKARPVTARVPRATQPAQLMPTAGPQPRRRRSHSPQAATGTGPEQAGGSPVSEMLDS